MMVKGNLYTVLVFVLLGLCVVVFAILAHDNTGGANANIQTYLVFIGPVVSSLLAMAVLSKQVDNVRGEAVKLQGQVGDIEKATNGHLEKQFADQTKELKSHLHEEVAQVSDEIKAANE